MVFHEFFCALRNNYAGQREVNHLWLMTNALHLLKVFISIASISSIRVAVCFESACGHSFIWCLSGLRFVVLDFSFTAHSVFLWQEVFLVYSGESETRQRLLLDFHRGVMLSCWSLITYLPPHLLWIVIRLRERSSRSAGLPWTRK